MNGYGILVSFLIAFFGIITAAIFLIIINIAVINKSKPLAKTAFIVVLMYALALGIFFAREKVRSIRFDSIPQLSVDGDQMTIINWGTGSMGSRAIYLCSEQGIIEEIDTPYYRDRMSLYIKFGYTFASRAAGALYVVVLESDCADPSYADVYEVKVDQDGSIAAEKVEHIDREQNSYKINVEEFIEHLVKEYGFSRESLEEKYGHYRNR